ncbi:cytochrome c biogenesis protein CcsA [Blattabacterium sp. (Blaberus giganteus)]|uniref:cytochrome c biogenesis protein CcsA n=1 Tax=Blattabacterium sp. (Blaberus giganteus) TaxID=1186051 RepID=UPI00025F7077|nr:cytochrome c biogenesis protein CcsA [Blattabacterium sp. (Blaberus giganteus)]AFJ90497.1 cytochrome c assembly protein [Blattabacterium sp. (Blaberus giganteus)]
MQKILKYILFSTKITSFLFLLLALSMAIATFIEKKYSTDVAKIFVYESTWFEGIMLFIIINLIGNIWKYKLWNYKKLPLFFFHLSFVLIFIGGIFSRYFSFEGTMSIREGEINGKIISRTNYMKLKISKGSYTRFYHDPYILSSFHYGYQGEFDFQKNPLKVKVIDYISCAKMILSKEKPEEKIIKIVSTNQRGRIDYFIKNGEIININGILFSFNKEIPFGIKIFEKNNKLYIKSSFSGKNINMVNRKINIFFKNTNHVLKIRNLYQIKINKDHEIMQWVIPDGVVKGKLKYIKLCDHEKNNQLSAITTKISFRNQSKLVTFLGGTNTINMSRPLFFKDYKISIGYGSIFCNLPFLLKLKKFKVENYPGSEFPSTFMSNVTLIDKNNRKDYLIYMNNVLNYKGFKFFQSGYDPDGKGTHFSVNNDYYGMYFTYIGYILMSIGMFFTLFWKGTRFSFLKKKLKYLASKSYSILFFIVFFFLFMIHNSVSAQMHEFKKIPLENVFDAVHIPKKHGENFGRLLVQDQKGRIKPINTIAIELLSKIHKKNHVGGLNANQWFISIHQDNIFWTKIPFIKVDKKGGHKLLKKVKANRQFYVSLIDLYFIDSITSKLKFLLQEDYQLAFSKSPVQRNEYDKAVLNLSERVGIMHEIFQGKYTRIFPIPHDINHTWSSWIRSDSNKLNPLGLSMFNSYLKALLFSQNEKNWNIADNEIQKIRLYQLKHAKSILPSENKISVEIIYNKLNIFYVLSFLYALFGTIIIINSFFTIFLETKNVFFIYKTLIFILFILFILNFLGLVSRWYISGHAPWANGYESAIFISWGLIGIGFLFYKNQFVSGITSLVSSILLMIAHGSAMDPEITNLVPVLKSHWLIIHVATITSSYGFFLTGSFLGFLVLILFTLKMCFRNYSERIHVHIEKLTIINEICLTIGLFLLTIGTFLGSVWANNSWGRYWSWDPKETWALISIMIYAFVLHIRLVPYLRSIFTFNFYSILSISSILMTYFGVNYYLSGLHSYAKGDPVSIPCWIYYSLLILLIIAILAYYSFKFHKKNIIK